MTGDKWLHFSRLHSSSDKAEVQADGRKCLPRLGGKGQGKALLHLASEALQGPGHVLFIAG